MANEALVTTGTKPLTVGSTYLFVADASLGDLPWDLSGGSGNLLLLDPTGVLHTYPVTISSGTAQVAWTAIAPAGEWARSWDLTDASGIRQISPGSGFTVIQAPA